MARDRALSVRIISHMPRMPGNGKRLLNLCKFANGRIGPTKARPCEIWRSSNSSGQLIDLFLGAQPISQQRDLMAGLGHLHDLLYGRLWHTTRPDRIHDIVASGSLMVDPDIDNSERWKTSRGPDYYPFVRTIGGISLFDFAKFDADLYDNTHPMSSWRSFVPYLSAWCGAVWIEVDREAIKDSFVSANEIVQRWNEGGYHRHTVMPRIEAAHIGDLPVSAFRSAFLTWAAGREVRAFDIREFKQADYDEILGEWAKYRGEVDR